MTEVYNQLSDTLGAYYKAHKNEATKSCISKSRVFSEFKKYAGAHRAHRGVSAFAEFESELQTPSSSRDQLKATRDQVPGRVSPHVEEALARRAIHNSTAAVAATLRSKIEAGRVSRPGGLFVSGEKLPSRPAPLSESPKVIPPPPVKRDPIRLSLESALSKNPVFCESEGSLK